MSTKIYHGYRLAAGTDIWEFTERLREQANVVRDRLDLEAIERAAEQLQAKRIIDGKGPFPDRESRLLAGYHIWDEVNRKLGSSRLSDPHQLDVTFIRDTATNRILALLYAGRETTKVFELQPGVEEYGYWNNADPPADVTEDEWEERRVVWDRCLGWDPPVRRGISFDLRGDPTDGIVEMIYRSGEKTTKSIKAFYGGSGE